MWMLENVRQSCRFVAENSEYVHIRHDRLEAYAHELARIKPEKPAIDLTCHYIGSESDTAAFFTILDTVNFGSGYFPHLKKLPGMSGYYTIASGLTNVFRKHPLKPGDLVSISPQDCAEIFGQDTGDRVVAELMGLYSTALQDLGMHVEQRYDSDFLNMIDSAGSSCNKLLEILTGMPFYRDVASYKGMQVSFFKRAQILSFDLFIAFEGKGPGFFEDIDRLTMFADNLVPHVLRLDGILEYDDDLASRIDSSELIPSGSSEEIEIRACAVMVVEYLSRIMHGHAGHIAPAVIDNMLWHKGQLPYYKKSRPRHRTRCVFY